MTKQLCYFTEDDSGTNNAACQPVTVFTNVLINSSCFYCSFGLFFFFKVNITFKIKKVFAKENTPSQAENLFPGNHQI